MNAFVVSGLVKRRAELAGDIENTHEALRKMVLDLESLDATIVQFDPDFQVETIKPKAFRPPKDWSNRGQMSRIILSTLRQASEPLTSRDIALQLLVERALDKSDLRLLRLMTKRVGVALRIQRENGVVRCPRGRPCGIKTSYPGFHVAPFIGSVVSCFCRTHCSRRGSANVAGADPSITSCAPSIAMGAPSPGWAPMGFLGAHGVPGRLRT
jgi:hypothetical protein